MGAAALTALCQGVCSVYCSCLPYRPQQSTICFAVTHTHTQLLQPCSWRQADQTGINN